MLWGCADTVLTWRSEDFSSLVSTCQTRNQMPVSLDHVTDAHQLNLFLIWAIKLRESVYLQNIVVMFTYFGQKQCLPNPYSLVFKERIQVLSFSPTLYLLPYKHRDSSLVFVPLRRLQTACQFSPLTHCLLTCE